MKKVCSLILAVCMVLALCPLSAEATTTSGETVAFINFPNNTAQLNTNSKGTMLNTELGEHAVTFMWNDAPDQPSSVVAVDQNGAALSDSQIAIGAKQTVTIGTDTYDYYWIIFKACGSGKFVLTYSDQSVREVDFSAYLPNAGYYSAPEAIDTYYLTEFRLTTTNNTLYLVCTGDWAFDGADSVVQQDGSFAGVSVDSGKKCAKIELDASKMTGRENQLRLKATLRFGTSTNTEARYFNINLINDTLASYGFVENLNGGTPRINGPYNTLNVSRGTHTITLYQDTASGQPMTVAAKFPDGTAIAGDLVSVGPAQTVSIGANTYYYYPITVNAFLSGNLAVTYPDGTTKNLPFTAALPNVWYYSSQTASAKDYLTEYHLTATDNTLYLACTDGWTLDSVSVGDQRNPCEYATVHISADNQYATITLDPSMITDSECQLLLTVAGRHKNGNSFSGRYCDIRIINHLYDPLAEYDATFDGELGLILPKSLIAPQSTANEFQYTVTKHQDGGADVPHAYDLTVTVSKGEYQNWINAYQNDELGVGVYFIGPNNAVNYISIAGNAIGLDNTFANMVDSRANVSRGSRSRSVVEFAAANKGQCKAVITPTAWEDHHFYTAWLNADNNVIYNNTLYVRVVVTADFKAEASIPEKHYPAKDRVVPIEDALGSNIVYAYDETTGVLTLSPKTAGENPTLPGAQNGQWTAFRINAPEGYHSGDGRDFVLWAMNCDGTTLNGIMNTPLEIYWFPDGEGQMLRESISLDITDVAPALKDYWTPLAASLMPTSTDPNIKLDYDPDTGFYHVSFPGNDLPSPEALEQLSQIRYPVPQEAVKVRENGFGGNTITTIGANAAEGRKGVLDNSGAFDAQSVPLQGLVSLHTMQLDGMTVYFNPMPGRVNGQILEYYSDEAARTMIGSAYYYGIVDDFVKEIVTESKATISAPVEAPTLVSAQNGAYHLTTKLFPQQTSDSSAKYFELELQEATNGSGSWTVYLPYSYIGVANYEEATARQLPAPVIHHYNETHTAYETITGEYTPNGIKFTTTSFSPFTITVPKSGNLDITANYDVVNGQVRVTVLLQNNPGVVSLKALLNYDDSVFTLKQVNDTGLLKGSVCSTEAEDMAEAPYTLMWFDRSNYAANNSNTGAVAELIFDIEKSAAGEYTFSVAADSQNTQNADRQTVIFPGVSASVTVPKTVYAATYDGSGKMLSIKQYNAASFVAPTVGSTYLYALSETMVPIGQPVKLP